MLYSQKYSCGFDDLLTIVTQFYHQVINTFYATFLRLKNRLLKLFCLLDVWYSRLLAGIPPNFNRLQQTSRLLPNSTAAGKHIVCKL